MKLDIKNDDVVLTLSDTVDINVEIDNQVSTSVKVEICNVDVHNFVLILI